MKLSMAAGFNGARLHEKVFEPRFLYHCDRLGYLVWGEQGNWGMDPSAPDGLKNFLPEWMEAVERDFNHPAIIGWCPFNETWDYEGRKQDDDLLAIVYRMTKLYDTTRPASIPAAISMSLLIFTICTTTSRTRKSSQAIMRAMQRTASWHGITMRRDRNRLSVFRYLSASTAASSGMLRA